ncbi:Spherulin-4 [Orbilia brochopaga]|nr:Spherulin-4 [Drechslerella brochopaga]
MDRPDVGPEKDPETHIDVNTVSDADTHDEQQNLLNRSLYGDHRYRGARPCQALMTAIALMFLTGLAAIICALQVGCNEDPIISNKACQPELASNLFKRMSVWNKLDAPPPFIGLAKRHARLIRPEGWPERHPHSELDQRSEDETWKYPKGSRPIHSLDSRKRSSTANQQVGIASLIIPLTFERGDNSTYWQPLFDIINSSPSTNFTIIMKPDNGPGTGDMGTDLQAGIKKLQSFPNTQILGHVHQSYSERDFSDVDDDLKAYASWRDPDTDIALDGILFDESPANAARASFVATVSSYANDRSLPLIYQNPGTMPDDTYFEVAQQTDVTIVFEGSFDNYATNASKYDGVATKYQVPSSVLGFIVYNCPIDTDSLRDAVSHMTAQVGHVFISSFSQNDTYTLNQTDKLKAFTDTAVQAFP